jgi:Protein of unknown function (DUF3570)
MRRPPEKRHHRAVSRFALLGAIIALFATRRAGAQAVEFDARTLFFFEPAKNSSMTVYTPSTDLTVRPWEFLAVSAGWEADIVSGASERIKAGPLSRNPDIVSGASQIRDVRHMGRGSVTVKRDVTQLTLGGSQSSENDYKSRSFNGAVKTDLFQHNTEIELAYARNWDSVCDAVHTANADATIRQPLDDSKGCFESSTTNRAERPIRTDAFQITWSQAWTPELLTQVVYTGQLQNGFLSDPYRAVVLSPAGQFAQEHHPDNRARQALALRAAYYLRPLKGAIRGGARLYHDTWNIWSGTVELEAEKYIFPWLRLRANARYYRQTEALFWSDDYTGGEPVHGPRGQYWTGDRELSPFSSVMVGGRALASWMADERRILGIFQGFQAGFGVDVLFYNYTDFTLAGRAPLDTKAYLGSLSLTALF